jgi:GT2 family glycosyltransferase
MAYKEGLFDKQMFMYYEDVDVDWRARLNGLRCWYASTAIGYHLGSTAQGRIHTQALANRYLSVIKNAFTYDVLTHNAIIILGHCMFKLCTEPAEGVWLIQRLAKTIPYAIKRRTAAKVSRLYMMNWFLLNKRQPTTQPKTITQRLLYYVNQQR